MHTRGELDKLIIEAQRGCEESRDRLSKLIRAPLEEYVYRLTLDNDTTQDIVQETMVTMFKVLGQLTQLRQQKNILGFFQIFQFAVPRY